MLPRWRLPALLRPPQGPEILWFQEGENKDGCVLCSFSQPGGHGLLCIGWASGRSPPRHEVQADNLQQNPGICTPLSWSVLWQGFVYVLACIALVNCPGTSPQQWVLRCDFFQEKHWSLLFTELSSLLSFASCFPRFASFNS